MVSKVPISGSAVVRSVPSAIKEVWGRILSELESEDFHQEDVFAVHLATEEAFLNALKHGNRMDSGKRVRIDYVVAPDRVEVSLTDEGDGFDPTRVPDPRCGENLYKTAGRGVFLMQCYMDVVEFNERGNSVRMIKYKGGTGAGRTPREPEA
ncbi:MAG TPA: ATP-binding protein [Sedimentisphaerales bacterium]|nr:ATP-binding protein [Sedimentisphaerales bacterium]